MSGQLPRRENGKMKRKPRAPTNLESNDLESNGRRRRVTKQSSMPEIHTYNTRIRNRSNSSTILDRLLHDNNAVMRVSRWLMSWRRERK